MNGANAAHRRLAGAVLFTFGFRPFFLMAALFAVIALPVWLAVYFDVIEPVSAFPAALWHGHEMLFGFTAAVVAGFFLTAVPNWTGAKPLSGGWLAALAALWLAGRIAIWGTPTVPVAVAAVIDFAFLPFLAMAIAPALRGGKLRNLVFLGLLGFFTLANLLFHLETLGLAETGTIGLTLAVDTVAMLITVVGGRVTPAFTMSALTVPGAGGAARVGMPRRTWLGELAIASVLVVLLLDLAFGEGMVSGIAALVAAVINGARMAEWKTLKILNRPLVWVLHLGYGWLVVGLAVKGLAAVTGGLSATVAIHGITIGAIGTMTLAMMSRASLGHTGRPLQAGPVLAAAYLTVSLAALVRLAGPLVAPAYYDVSILVSGLLWALAFTVFTILFWPILTRPRIDPRSG